jgi:hypothetical protein
LAVTVAPAARASWIAATPTPLQLGLREERVVRGCEHLDEAARLGPAPAVGHVEHVSRVDRHQLGVAAAGKERHHAAAVLGLACALEPRHVGHARRRRIPAGTLAQIGTVHAGCADADEQLAVAGNRVGTLLGDEPAVVDGSHAHSVMLRA